MHVCEQEVTVGKPELRTGSSHRNPGRGSRAAWGRGPRVGRGVDRNLGRGLRAGRGVDGGEAGRGPRAGPGRPTGGESRTSKSLVRVQRRLGVEGRGVRHWGWNPNRNFRSFRLFTVVRLPRAHRVPSRPRREPVWTPEWLVVRLRSPASPRTTTPRVRRKVT